MPDVGAVTEILRTAREAVEAAALPDNLKVAAFEKAVDIFAVEMGVVARAMPPAADPATPPVPPVPTANAADQTLAKVAAKLGVSMTSVDGVFHIENEAPVLSLGSAKLSSAVSDAVKEITLLIAAARQGGGWDAEWTPTSAIRAVAEHYGKLDGNFASHVTSMDDDLTFSGSGVSRRVKLRRQGWEKATALVKQLAGEE